MIRQLCAGGLVLILTATSWSQTRTSPVDKLRRDIEGQIDKPFMENATWSIVVESLTRHDTLFSFNSRKGMTPASNMKLFSSALALDKLGPDFTYKTTLWAKGCPERDTIWDGDLIVRGQGDPTLSGRFRDNNMLAVFEEWADSLRSRGIRRICGHVIGDDNIFEEEVLGRNWEWDGESYWYSAQISGLCFNDNCIDWYITPGKIGRRARVLVMPNTNYVDIRNETLTVTGSKNLEPVELIRDRATNIFRAKGRIPAGSETITGWAAVENPTWYTVTVFKDVLEKTGITLEGQPLDIDSVHGFHYEPSDSNLIRIATYESPKLAEMLKIVNKRSQNLYAEQIWRSVPAVLQGKGSGDSAAAMTREFLSSIGINTDRLTIADGSGYARTNQVSTSDVIALLKHMRKHPHWKQYKESLAIAGVDGTLSYRMKDTAAQGVVRAKTGYIDKVRSISGYVHTRGGEELVFSMICNNFTVDKSEIERVQDNILIRLAEFVR